MKQMVVTNCFQNYQNANAVEKNIDPKEGRKRPKWGVKVGDETNGCDKLVSKQLKREQVWKKH